MKLEENKLTPDDCKILFNGSTYSELVFLGTLDSPENWQEVPYEQYEEYLKSQEEEIQNNMEINEGDEI